MRKNKKIIMAMAILLAIATLTAGFTFAWFNAQDSVTNHMETGQLTNGDVVIAEIFDEDDDFAPGVDINKIVWTVNGGSVDALVRMSFAEVLDKLANGGASAGVSAVYDGSANKIPQLFNKGLVSDSGAYSDWDVLDLDDPSCPFTLSATSVDITDIAGLTVLYLETVLDADPNNVKTKYNFVAYGTISAAGAYQGELQRVSFEVELDKDEMELTFANVLFYEFSKLATIERKWAELRTDDPEYGFTKNTPSFVNGDLPRIPAVSDYDPFPTDPGYLELVFSEIVTASIAVAKASPTPMWWYNTDDGYFYYIGKLAPGQASDPLLTAVGIHEAAEDAYCNLSFDLIVKMDAIQNVEEALSSTAGGGWGLSDTVLADLIDALKAHGAFVLS